MNVIAKNTIVICEYELIKIIFNDNIKDIETKNIEFRKKWLAKWWEAKKETKDQKLQIYNIYKNSPEDFKREQKVELFKYELEIKSEFPWTLLKAYK